MAAHKPWLQVLEPLLLSALSLTAMAAAGPAEPASGQALFNAVGCWACHGYGGQGTLSGPQIAPSALPLPIFQQLLRHPARLMPAYGAAVLNDAQVASLYAYLQSRSPPRHAADIVPLKP
jgi:mono/diheme cytochrome c family protein